VEAVAYFLLPLPAPYQVNRFRVYFRKRLISVFKVLWLHCFQLPLPHPWFTKTGF